MSAYPNCPFPDSCVSRDIARESNSYKVNKYAILAQAVIFAVFPTLTISHLQKYDACCSVVPFGPGPPVQDAVK